ncbi:IclR family transcriptional regulator [Thermodesulfobacteriota bacterium]
MEHLFYYENLVFHGEQFCLRKMMTVDFKRVPALDKCFAILEQFAREKKSLGITDISKALNLNKSTVYNIVHTLSDLGVLDNGDGKFRFGPKLYMLGKAAENSSEMLRIIHPHLETISEKTNLTTFLGIQSGRKAIILDRADSSDKLKISSEIGIRIPLLAGAHGQALLSLQSDDEINEILSQNELKSFTRFSTWDKKQYLNMIRKVQKERIAFEDEEYIEGLRALAVPLRLKRRNLHMAIWAVGLKSQLPEKAITPYSDLLREIAEKIENQISFA